MHTEREKHNKKLWSYRLTFTSQNLLLLLRKILKGRKNELDALLPPPCTGSWGFVFFFSFHYLPHYFFSNLQRNANDTTLISSLKAWESPRLKAGWCIVKQLPLTKKKKSALLYLLASLRQAESSQTPAPGDSSIYNGTPIRQPIHLAWVLIVYSANGESYVHILV